MKINGKIQEDDWLSKRKKFHKKYLCKDPWPSLAGAGKAWAVTMVTTSEDWRETGDAQKRQMEISEPW